METIGEHFKRDLGCKEEAVRLITMDQYPKGGESVGWELLELCAAVVDELADQPYSGPATHALIMDIAMKRLKAQHGKNAPRPWVPVIRQLHAMAG